MKIVSVPTLKEVEVTTCDICGKDVGDYRWWMSMETDDGVATLVRGDEIRYYSFCDIEHDIMNGYWISSVCQQVRSPSVKRKLEGYEV